MRRRSCAETPAEDISAASVWGPTYKYGKSASLWQYVFPQLGCEKVGKHSYTRVVATMGVAKDPKLRAMFRRHIKRPDQRYVALAQIARKTREAEAFANRG